MVSYRHLVTVPISIAAFVSSFLVVGKLIWFLSVPTQIPGRFVWLLNLLDDRARLEAALLPITTDLILVTLFVLQHSLMRSAIVSRLWSALGLATVERSIYNLATAGTLFILLLNWKSIPTFILWQIDVQQSTALWWTFVGIHVVAWSIIFGGSILMDLPELLGIKQVYYDLRKLLPPMLYKSDELKRLYGHIRHPSFTSLFVILFATNIMSLDRLLLALLWTTYMYVSWSPDQDDVMYHKCQLTRKKAELTNGGRRGSRVQY